MKKGKYLLILLLLLFGVTNVVSAAPVGLTSKADARASSEVFGDSDFGLGLSIGYVGDFVDERKIDIDKGEFEMQAHSARIELSMLDRLNFYVDLGQAIDMEYTYVILGEKYITDFDDEFIWGIGGSALIHRWDNGLEVGINGSYRQADMILDKTSIDGRSSSRSSLTNITDGEFQEYQGALELGWRTQYATPYVGVKFSEVEVDARFTTGGSVRDASGKNAGENVGLFAGVTLTPSLAFLPKPEQIAVNLEGRFVDETAFNAEVSYKF